MKHFRNSLIEFLCTDLDGNLSSTLNSLTASRLDNYLSRLFEGLSETANKGKVFDQNLLNEKSKDHLIDEIIDIALFATQISLSIFTNLFHQRFEKHSMLKSMLEILQQFYIQVEKQSDEFHLFAGDLSTYMSRSKRCGQPVTLHGSIGEILYDEPAAMLYHWNIIEPHDEQIHRESMLMPQDLNICQKPTKYGKSMFCEAVKVDMENSKESSFHHTITSTLSLITVLFEDLFEAIILHRDFSDEKVRLEPSTLLLNKTNTCDGHDFNIDIFTDEFNALQKRIIGDV
jgi:hypothetical protein